MGEYLKIDASLVSYVGITDSAGTGSYYINGKYTCRPPISNMNISVANISDTQLFAVTEGMETGIADRNAPVSLVENIHRYYQKNADNVDDLEEALDGLHKIVSDTFEKVKEQVADDAFNASEPSLASILLHENSAGIISAGGSRIYLVRNGSLKLLDEDSRKSDAANKTEDYSDEPEEEIAIDGDDAEAGRELPRKSNIFEIKPGDVFLLSSNSLIDYLDQEALLYIMSLDGDSAYMSVTAMDEVLKRQRKQDILLQVIKIDEIKGTREHRPLSRLGQRSAVRASAAAAVFETPPAGSAAREFTGRMPSKSVSRKVKRVLKLVLSTVVIFAVVFGIFMGLQRLLFGPPENGGETTTIAGSKPTTTKPTTTAAPTTGGATTTAEPTTTPAPTTTVKPTTARPTTTASSTTAYTGNYQEYTVKKGDTLSSISRQFYGDTSKINLIMQANNIKNADMIEIGDVLKIPILN